MVRDSTLYNRLGIQSDATDEQIKKAFNQLSKKWHLKTIASFRF